MWYSVELSNYCQLKCIFCPKQYGHREKGRMNLDTFTSLAEQIKAHDSQFPNVRIALHGIGEPLLSPILFDALAYLDKLGFKTIDFSTNGILLTDETIKKLMSFKCLSLIKVSLNSSRKNIVEEMSQATDFDLVVANTKNLIKANTNKRIMIQLMSTLLNQDEMIEDMYNLFQGGNFEVVKTYAHRVKSLVPVNKATNKEFRDCIYYAQYSLFIHWDGSIAGCCFDNTDRQLCGKVSDGIFSATVQAKIKEYQKNNPPLCIECLESCK